MKKSILSLIAVFTVGIASAQSYSRQPDPKVYNVVRYQKKAEVTEETPSDNSEIAATEDAGKEANTPTLVNTEGKLESTPATAVADNENQ